MYCKGKVFYITLIPLRCVHAIKFSGHCGTHCKHYTYTILVTITLLLGLMYTLCNVPGKLCYGNTFTVCTFYIRIRRVISSIGGISFVLWITYLRNVRLLERCTDRMCNFHVYGVCINTTCT